MKLPKRQPLAVETEKVIREMIRSGEIKLRLPGERDLAVRLQIGRDTLRAALAELEKKGWISEGRHGKRRSILKTLPDEGTGSQNQRIGFLSPKRIEKLPPAMLLEINQVREMLGQKNVSLDIHSPSIFNLKRPSARLHDLVDSRNYDLWILYQTNEYVQHWFAKHKVPCLVRGQVHAGINLPSLDQDWRAVAYHSAISLISKGHRSIGLVIPDISLRGLHAVKGGVEDAIAKSPYKIKLHLMEERGTTESLSALMHRACAASDSPTGILATRSRHVLTIVSWLASKRMSIPQDMSLISLTYDNVLSALLPRIAHYHLDVSNMARSFVRKVDAVIDGQGQGGKLLIPDFFAGESVRKLNPSR